MLDRCTANRNFYIWPLLKNLLRFKTITNMKKIYLLALAVCTSVAGFAQYKMSPAAIGKKMPRENAVASTPDYNADRNTIWSNDFSNCEDWIIQNANTDAGLGQYIDGINFQCGTEVPSGPASIAGIASPTADNGFMMVDSDAFGGEAPGVWVENCWFQSAQPIDITGQTALSLRFYTQYRMWDNGSSDGNEYCLVEISTDGVTWPDPTTYEVSDNDTPNTFRYELWPEMQTQDPVNNPTLKVFNISEAIAAPGDQIWLRFRWKGYWGYAWMVDDIEIFQTPDNDLTLGKTWVGQIVTAYEYHAVPIVEAENSEVSFGAEVSNFGAIDQSATLTISINGNDYVVTENIPAGVTDTLWTEPFQLPLDPNNYEVTYSLPDDAFNEGNTGVNNIEVTDIIYGHNNDFDPLSQRGFNEDLEVAMGNLYTISAETTAGGAYVLIGSGSDEGVLCQANLYEVLTNVQDVALVASSAEFSVTAQMMDDGDNGIYTPIAFEELVTLEAGKSYILQITRFESTDRLFIWSNLDDDDFGTVCYGPFGTNDAVNNYVGWSFTPSVRLILGEVTIGVDELAAGDIAEANIFPNPVVDNATITFNLANSNKVSTIVRDITGRVVSTKEFGILPNGNNRVEFNVENFSAGVYTVSLVAGSSVVTKEIVVR